MPVLMQFFSFSGWIITGFLAKSFLGCVCAHASGGSGVRECILKKVEEQAILFSCQGQHSGRCISFGLFRVDLQNGEFLTTIFSARKYAETDTWEELVK